MNSDETKTKKPIYVKGYYRHGDPVAQDVEIEPATTEEGMTGKELAVFAGLSMAYIFALLVKNAPKVAAWIIVAMVTIKLVWRPVRRAVREYLDSRDPNAIQVNAYFRKRWFWL